MTAFAKAQLIKYGWTEGKGLGKNETGITVALKPKLKFDTAGIGHKEGDSDQWWETVFNKAANNIKVESRDDEVSISVPKLNVPNKSDRPKQSSGYKNFYKTSTLQNGIVVPEVAPQDAEVTKLEDDIVQIKLTDEELYKACGGRTGHKGARHGLTLSGKLERIARQENELLNSNNSFLSLCLRKPEPGSKLDLRSSDSEQEKDSNANTVSPELESRVVSKRRRKRHKRCMNKLTEQLGTSWNLSDESKTAEENCATEPKTKRKNRANRKRARNDNESVATKQVLSGEITSVPLPETKKENTELFFLDGYSSNELYESASEYKSGKKKKLSKSKHKHWEQYIAKLKQRERIVAFSKKSKKFKKEQIDLDFRIKEETRPVEDENIIHKNRFDAEKFRIHDRLNESTGIQAALLNARIIKKKRLLSQRRENIRLNKITESLSAVHFDTEESGKAVSSKAKMETIVKDLMAVNLTENVTKSMKALKKSKKKREKKQCKTIE